MAPNPRLVIQRLQSEVWDKIPSAHCKGLCQAACSVIPCSIAEGQAVQRATGRPLAPDEKMTCSALENTGACAAYDLRPTICRLFGVCEGMECEHGCTPSHYLTREEAKELLAKADEIGGVNQSDRDDLMALTMWYQQLVLLRRAAK